MCFNSFFFSFLECNAEMVEMMNCSARQTEDASETKLTAILFKKNNDNKNKNK